MTAAQAREISIDSELQEKLPKLNQEQSHIINMLFVAIRKQAVNEKKRRIPIPDNAYNSTAIRTTLTLLGYNFGRMDDGKMHIIW